MSVTGSRGLAIAATGGAATTTAARTRESRSWRPQSRAAVTRPQGDWTVADQNPAATIGDANGLGDRNWRRRRCQVGTTDRAFLRYAASLVRRTVRRVTKEQPGEPIVRVGLVLTILTAPGPTGRATCLLLWCNRHNSSRWQGLASRLSENNRLANQAES